MPNPPCIRLPYPAISGLPPQATLELQRNFMEIEAQASCGGGSVSRVLVSAILGLAVYDDDFAVRYNIPGTTTLTITDHTPLGDDFQQGLGSGECHSGPDNIPANPTADGSTNRIHPDVYLDFLVAGEWTVLAWFVVSNAACTERLYANITVDESLIVSGGFTLPDVADWTVATVGTDLSFVDNADGPSAVSDAGGVYWSTFGLYFLGPN